MADWIEDKPLTRSELWSTPCFISPGETTSAVLGAQLLDEKGLLSWPRFSTVAARQGVSVCCGLSFRLLSCLASCQKRQSTWANRSPKWGKLTPKAPLSRSYEMSRDDGRRASIGRQRGR